MDLASLGMQAASQGGGMALGWADELIMGGYRRKKQLEQQQALTNQQVQANKELAHHNKELEFDLWNKTNYEAQVAHMKKAGLNPALMYGQAGQGVTGTAGQSAGSGHASDEASRQQASVASAGMALQMAQIENIKAQTNKTNVEAENIGSQTKINYKRIDELTESIKGKSLQNTFDELRNFIQSETMYNDIDRVRWESRQAGYQLEIIKNAKDISDQTKSDTIKSVRLQLENLVYDILQKDATINLTKEQAKAVSENILIGYINANANKEQASKWTWQQALGNALVKSGTNVQASEQLSKGLEALSNIVPKENEGFLEWLKRNW